MSAAKYLASKVDHEAEGLELHAERDEALTALAESRARFADSEARRAELEAVIRRVDGLLSHAADQSDPYVSTSREALNASPSVVLEDRDRENRAIGWDEGAEMVLRAEGIENVANTLANLAENGHPNPYRGDTR